MRPEPLNSRQRVSFCRPTGLLRVFPVFSETCLHNQPSHSSPVVIFLDRSVTNWHTLSTPSRSGREQSP